MPTRADTNSAGGEGLQAQVAALQSALREKQREEDRRDEEIERLQLVEARIGFLPIWQQRQESLSRFEDDPEQ